MTCSNCGAEFEGRFCAQCGTEAPDADGQSQNQSSAPPPPQGQPTPKTAQGAMDDNVAGTLCYVLGFITGIIFLILEPYNRNKLVRFHAFQSIFLSVAAFALNVFATVLTALTGGLLFFAWPVVSLGIFVLWIILLLKTYQGQKVVLPIVGPIAEKQA